MSNENIILQCRGLTKTFTQASMKVPVLREINLDIHEGETVAIVGASGSGKSTLLHILGGLDAPSAGTVELMGRDFTTMSAAEAGAWRNQHLGFVYQFHHLLPDFSARENVMLAGLVAGRTDKAAATRADQLLTDLGLGDRLNHRPSELSGGEQQRVAVARALANKPALVLADEPTGNLDEATANIVFAEFLNLVRDEGSSAIVATHNERIAAKMDRVLRLHDGHLI